MCFVFSYLYEKSKALLTDDILFSSFEYDCSVFNNLMLFLSVYCLNPLKEILIAIIKKSIISKAFCNTIIKCPV